MTSAQDKLLPMTLEASVMIRLLQLRQSPVYPVDLLNETIPCTWCPKGGTCSMCKGTGRATRAENAGRLIAERADIMLFGGGQKGQAAEVFNALAEMVSYMAFLPGGITTFGMHFEATWPDSGNMPAAVLPPVVSKGLPDIVDFLLDRKQGTEEPDAARASVGRV